MPVIIQSQPTEGAPPERIANNNNKIISPSTASIIRYQHQMTVQEKTGEKIPRLKSFLDDHSLGVAKFKEAFVKYVGLKGVSLYIEDDYIPPPKPDAQMSLSPEMYITYAQRYEKYRIGDGMVLAMLRTSMEDGYEGKLKNAAEKEASNAKEAWANFNAHYADNKPDNIVILLEALFKTKLSNCNSIDALSLRISKLCQAIEEQSDAENQIKLGLFGRIAFFMNAVDNKEYNPVKDIVRDKKYAGYTLTELTARFSEKETSIAHDSPAPSQQAYPARTTCRLHPNSKHNDSQYFVQHPELKPAATQQNKKKRDDVGELALMIKRLLQSD